MTKLRKYYILVFLFAFLLYGNSLKNNYSLDDEIVTSTYKQKNPRIEKGIKGIPGLFKSYYVETGKQNYDYRPVALVSFALEYQFFKNKPYIGHLINVLIYGLTCVLVFSLLAKIFSKHHLLYPLIMALVFAAHPLHTEVVDNIKNRDELLSFLFALCSMHYALKYVDKKNIKPIVLSVFFLLLALLSKKTALIFIALIPLTIYFFRPVRLTKVFALFTSFILTAILFIALKKLLLHDAVKIREFVFTENPLFFEKNFLNRIPVALYTLGFYLKLFLVPYPLSAYYGFNVIPMAGWTNPYVWVSLSVYLAAGIFALIQLPKKSPLSYGILIYLLAIAPFSNLIHIAVGMVADRFTYPASLGFSVTVVLLLLKLFKIPEVSQPVFRKNHLAFFVSIALIAATYSSLTISRNSHWKDLLTLFRNDVKNYDNSYNLHYMIASNLTPKIFSSPDGPQRRQMIEEATAHYHRISEIVESGIEKYPSDYISRNNLGTIYVNYLNTPEKAHLLFEQAIALKPGYVEAHYNLGFSYEKRNMPDSAIKYYKKTLLLDDHYMLAYARLNEIYLKNNEYKNAIENSLRSIQAFPGKAEFYIHLGNAYLLEKDTISGIKYFEQAVRLEPSNNNLRLQVINFLKSAGFPEKAKNL